jgi:hypothetical protein
MMLHAACSRAWACTTWPGQLAKDKEGTQGQIVAGSGSRRHRSEPSLSPTQRPAGPDNRTEICELEWKGASQRELCPLMTDQGLFDFLSFAIVSRPDLLSRVETTYIALSGTMRELRAHSSHKLQIGAASASLPWTTLLWCEVARLLNLLPITLQLPFPYVWFVLLFTVQYVAASFLFK